MRRTSAHGFSMKQAEPHDRNAERAYAHGCHPEMIAVVGTLEHS